MRTYLGITFREDYKSFPEFKKAIGHAWPFKRFLPEQREKELEKAYKIATGKNAKDELSGSTNKSGKGKSIKRKQGTIPRDKKD